MNRLHDDDDREYTTHTLPQYVLNYFGGYKECKLHKTKDGMFTFSGGGQSVKLPVRNAILARQKIRVIIQRARPEVLKDGRVG